MFSGILVPGGFGVRGTEGKIQAISWARKQKKPFLGKDLPSTHSLSFVAVLEVLVLYVSITHPPPRRHENTFQLSEADHHLKSTVDVTDGQEPSYNIQPCHSES